MTTTTTDRNGGPRVEVRREPLTYERGGEQSYFRDLALASAGDTDAERRLDHHGGEMRVELAAREVSARKRLDEARDDPASPVHGLEYRVNPNRTPGQGGNFAPPLWLIDQFATAPRAGRVLAAAIPGFPLPPGVQSLNLPRLTTGTSAQSVTDGAMPVDQDIVDAQSPAPVVTVSGLGDVSLQALEQSPTGGGHLDFCFFKDLTESYNSTLETQLINGSGSAGQLTGLIQQTPGSNQIVFTSGAPTGILIAPLLGQTIASIGINRKRPPEMWVMSTAREAWLASSLDASSRPFMINDNDELLGYPVALSDAVPRTLGAGTNQEPLIACRPSDLLLFESEPRAVVALEPLSGTLQARIRLHRYVCAFTGRYPSSIASLLGTGTIPVTGF